MRAFRAAIPVAVCRSIQVCLVRTMTHVQSICACRSMDEGEATLHVPSARETASARARQLLDMAAKQRKLLGRVLWITVVLLCVLGCLSQVFIFLEIFWKFPTIIEVETERTDDLDFPGVTLCNNNRVRLSQLCRLRGETNCVQSKSRGSIENLDAMLRTMNKSLRSELGHQKSTMIFETSKVVNGTVEVADDQGFRDEFFHLRYSNCYSYNVEWTGSGVRDAEIARQIGEYSAQSTMQSPRLPALAPRRLENDPVPGAARVPAPGRVARCPDRISRPGGHPRPRGGRHTTARWTQLHLHAQTDDHKAAAQALLDEVCQLSICASRAVCHEDDQIAVREGVRLQRLAADVSLHPGGRGAALRGGLGQAALRQKTLLRRRHFADTLLGQSLGRNRSLPEEILSTTMPERDRFSRLNITTVREARMNLTRIYLIYGTLNKITYRHRAKYEQIELFSYLGGFIGIWIGVSFLNVLEYGTQATTWLYHKYKERKTRRLQDADELKVKPISVRPTNGFPADHW
ncbi:uncharacterized protein LOC142771484 isoform X2 [Rhipicephalus microplus]|uniref:uncharacterized protein LOC142771484 isoform X2 n=1 Tax=Rhipicephalus microplus TaxID=6941 RepID=UPI003F6BE17D